MEKFRKIYQLARELIKELEEVYPTLPRDCGYSHGMREVEFLANMELAECQQVNDAAKNQVL